MRRGPRWELDAPLAGATARATTILSDARERARALPTSNKPRGIEMPAIVRKTLFLRETALAELGKVAVRPVVRAAALVVIANPLAGRYAEDLGVLFGLGGELGQMLMHDLVGYLGAPPVAYGKGAIVGLAGEMEHGGACIHPTLGRPMRAAIGGGEALIPSNVKVAAAGATLDVPLGHKDDAWSFDHFDTITVMVPDAPRPDEIVVVMAIADGGRLAPRCGKSPAR
jgi:hypothetical protein